MHMLLRGSNLLLREFDVTNIPSFEITGCAIELSLLPSTKV